MFLLSQYLKLLNFIVFSNKIWKGICTLLYELIKFFKKAIQLYIFLSETNYFSNEICDNEYKGLIDSFEKATAEVNKMISYFLQ